MTQLDEATRKKLTEFIGECWHEGVIWIASARYYECHKCEKAFIARRDDYNRTFTLDADMLAVYRAIQKADRWGGFALYAGEYWYTYHWQVQKKPLSLNSWLFCLSNPAEIPERMKMVAEFIEKENI